MPITSKMFHKGSVWSHHGKIRGRVCRCIELNRRVVETKRKREEWDAVIESVIQRNQLKKSSLPKVREWWNDG